MWDPDEPHCTHFRRYDLRGVVERLSSATATLRASPANRVDLMHEHRARKKVPAPHLVPINKSVWESSGAYQKQMELPYKGIGEPGDVANAAVRLASDDSDFVIGTCLFVDDGMALYPGFAEGG